MGQQELQDLVVQTFPGHVYGAAPPTVVELQVGTVEEQEPGGVVAAIEGRQEKRRLTLVVKYSTVKPCLYIHPSII